jgi:hypothetical protein
MINIQYQTQHKKQPQLMPSITLSIERQAEGHDPPLPSASGYDFIKRSEGLRLEAYDDATGKTLKPGEKPKGTATIGY